MKKLLLFVLCLPLLAFSTTYKQTKISKLVETSTLIVEGTIAAKNAAWRGGKIITTVNVDVNKVLKGEAQQSIQFEMLGGRVAGEELVVHGSPNLQEGQRVMLVLVYHRGAYRLHSMGMGQFEVLKVANETIYYNDNVADDILISEQPNSYVKNKPVITDKEIQQLTKVD